MNDIVIIIVVVTCIIVTAFIIFVERTMKKLQHNTTSRRLEGTIVDTKKLVCTSLQRFGPGPFTLSTNERMHVFNPSIAMRDGKLFVVARLSSTAKCKNPMPHYITDSVIDSNFNVFNERYKFDSSLIIYFHYDSPFAYKVFDNYTSESNNNISLGMEDPRVFTFQNELWIYFHYRGYRNNRFVHVPAIFKMSTPNDIIYLGYNGMSEIEKNWMPFEYKHELYFEYSIHPRMILKCNHVSGKCTLVHSSNYKNPLGKHVGGGAPAQPVTIDNKLYYLGIGHTRKNAPKTLRKNFFYFFKGEFPFNIVGMSDEFDIHPDNDIEFASGLVVTNNKVLVSVGIQDCYSILCKYDLNNVLNFIKPIPI